MREHRNQKYAYDYEAFNPIDFIGWPLSITVGPILLGEEIVLYKNISI